MFKARRRSIGSALLADHHHRSHSDASEDHALVLQGGSIFPRGRYCNIRSGGVSRSAYFVDGMDLPIKVSLRPLAGYHVP